MQGGFITQERITYIKVVAYVRLMIIVCPLKCFFPLVVSLRLKFTPRKRLNHFGYLCDIVKPQASIDSTTCLSIK